MPNRKQGQTDETITKQQMEEAIRRSGYLLEQRVCAPFNEANYKVMANQRFIDQEENKSREYDILAYKDIAIFESASFGIFPTIICECKNIMQPVTFFIDEDTPFQHLIDEVMVSGIPAKIWKKNKWVSIQEYVNIDSFHHYCRPKAEVATQCCTFIKSKEGPWKANHIGELYETCRTLIKVLEYEIEEDFKNMSQWFSTGNIKEEFMDLSIYYPLLIFPGDMYTYSQNGDEPLKPCKHVQYNPEFISFHSNSMIYYHLDIITEEYLQDYLQIIEQEMLSLKTKLNQNKDEVLLSVSKIVKECRGLRRKPKIYREYLEFLADT